MRYPGGIPWDAYIMTRDLITKKCDIHWQLVTLPPLQGLCLTNSSALSSSSQIVAWLCPFHHSHARSKRSRSFRSNFPSCQPNSFICSFSCAFPFIFFLFNIAHTFRGMSGCSWWNSSIASCAFVKFVTGSQDASSKGYFTKYSNCPHPWPLLLIWLFNSLSSS